jgi:H+-translocating NAD(P) transhydrogenase subunit alpha
VKVYIFAGFIRILYISGSKKRRMKLIKLSKTVFILAIIFYVLAFSAETISGGGKEFISQFRSHDSGNSQIADSRKTSADIQVAEEEISSVRKHQPEQAISPAIDYWSMLFVLVLASFIGLGVILRVSRLLHTPLMSLTNAISAIAVVGSIMVTGEDYPLVIRILGAIALFASMTNIVSGFMITDRMLKMFRQKPKEVKQ